LGESEQDMLRLASESADRMDSLVKMLGRIAGTPQSLSPQPVRL